MLDIDKIHEAIDAFCLKQEAMEFDVRVPAQKERFYLGMSAIGGECLRAVWYDFRKVAKKQFPARLLRLFRRGDIQEYQFIYLLRGIGFTVWEKDENGKQFKATDFEGHFSGSMDGVGEAPKKFWKKGKQPQPFLLEFKTYKDSRFNKLRKEKVRKSDPKYWTQCQAYMGYNDLKGCLFCAVNKDDDNLYFEWVEFSKIAFESIVDKAETILTVTEPPDKIPLAGNGNYICKYCDFREICIDRTPAVKSCRSCVHGRPAENAAWSCEKGHDFGTVCNDYSDITKA
jgi:hypothetical protein